MKRKQVEHTRTERRVLGSMRHPFIVRLHFAFQTAAKLYFVLDYCAGGELFFHLSRLKKLPEPMACFYAVRWRRAGRRGGAGNRVSKCSYHAYHSIDTYLRRSTVCLFR